MQFENINIDALQRATDYVVGPDGTATVAKTYHAFHAAMQAAFEEGRALGRAEAEQDVEDRLDTAFDEGFEQGSAFQELEDEADAAQAADECYEDGYLDGVADARARPGIADTNVAGILWDRAGDAFDALDELVQDEA